MRVISRSIVKGCTSATAGGHFHQDRGQREKVYLDHLLFGEIFFLSALCWEKIPNNPVIFLRASLNNLYTQSLLIVREGFKNPRHGNFPLGPPRTRIFRKVSGKKLTEKGGIPPLHGQSVAQKTPFLGQFLMDFS